MAPRSMRLVRSSASAGLTDLRDGIHVDSPSTTIEKNTANFNTALGIRAVPGVTDGGGNKAQGNGDPAQCTGVVCS
jgi:hypothetical protein